MLEERRSRIINPTQYSGLGKLPPQATDLEEAILGALMLEKDAILGIIDICKPEIFYRDNHKKIFSAIFKLFSRSNPIDILTVTAELRSAGELEMIGGAYYITELTNRVTGGANIEYHCEIVYKKYLQRELIRISTETINNAYEDTSDAFDIIDNNENSISALLSTKHGSTISDLSDLVSEQSSMLHQPEITGLLGVGTGFYDLDKITNGWRNPDLIIIAARPSMGKTAFMLNCARNAAVDFDKPGLIFSLEMSKEQLTQRMISAEAAIPLDHIIKRRLSDYDLQRFDKVTEKLSITKKIHIDDTASISILELKAKAKRLKIKHNIEWIMIDYLQLMRGNKDKNGNREQEISSISSGLKALAKELDIPVIALSQLNREVEKTPSKRPNLSHLRESGAIEQDADLVGFLYRPEYYGYMEDADGNSTAGMAEFIIAKHRNGVCENIKLMFNGSIMKFKSYTEPLIDPSDDKPKNFIIKPNKMFEQDSFTTDESDPVF